jgi:hypothetical protein
MRKITQAIILLAIGLLFAVPALAVKQRDIKTF